MLYQASNIQIESKSDRYYSDERIHWICFLFFLRWELSDDGIFQEVFRALNLFGIFWEGDTFFKPDRECAEVPDLVGRLVEHC
jgi:hypothetical protein